MRRGWLRRNRLTTTLPYTIRLCARVWLTPSHNQAYFFGEVLRAEALGLKREDRPAAFAGRSESVFLDLLLVGYHSCLHRRVSYSTRVLPQHRRPVT